MWGCRFEDHGIALIVQFDKQTDRELSSFVSIDGDGHDSRRIWVNSTKLRIELGYGFDVRVRDDLELNAGNVCGIDGDTPAASGVCEVSPAYNPPNAPDVRIIGATSMLIVKIYFYLHKLHLDYAHQFDIHSLSSSKAIHD